MELGRRLGTFPPTQETIDEQQAQKEILIHQTEIIALNTVMLRALVLPDNNESEIIDK
jgi:hypothetical protein